jgi:hypothetical protein
VSRGRYYRRCQCSMRLGYRRCHRSICLHGGHPAYQFTHVSVNTMSWSTRGVFTISQVPASYVNQRKAPKAHVHTHIHPSSNHTDKQARQNEDEPHPRRVRRGEQRTAPTWPRAHALSSTIFDGLFGKPVYGVAIFVLGSIGYARCESVSCSR